MPSFVLNNCVWLTPGMEIFDALNLPGCLINRKLRFIIWFATSFLTDMNIARMYLPIICLLMGEAIWCIRALIGTNSRFYYENHWNIFVNHFFLLFFFFLPFFLSFFLPPPLFLNLLKLDDAFKSELVRTFLVDGSWLEIAQWCSWYIHEWSSQLSE